MSYAPSGDLLLTAGIDGQAELWHVHADVVTNHFSRLWRLADPWIDSWAKEYSSPFICNGKFLWLVYWGSELSSVVSKLFDLQTGECVHEKVFPRSNYCMPLMMPDYRGIELLV